jgi:hypothetical protein
MASSMVDGGEYVTQCSKVASHSDGRKLVYLEIEQSGRTDRVGDLVEGEVVEQVLHEVGRKNLVQAVVIDLIGGCVRSLEGDRAAHCVALDRMYSDRKHQSLTVTPFQKATYPAISLAASLGSG